MPSQTDVTVETEIDGETYILTLWTTTQCFKWQEELLQLGLEPLMQLLSGDDDGLSGAAGAGRLLIKRLGAEGMPKMIRRLLDGMYRMDPNPKEPDGPPKRSVVAAPYKKGSDKHAPDTFDVHYRGRSATIYKLIWWAIDSNLRDFIDGARSLVEARRKKSRTDSLLDEAVTMAAAGNREGANETLTQLVATVLAMVPSEETEATVTQL